MPETTEANNAIMIMRCMESLTPSPTVAWRGKRCLVDGREIVVRIISAQNSDILWG